MIMLLKGHDTKHLDKKKTTHKESSSIDIEKADHVFKLKDIK